jgi:hypothetical protein
MAKEKRLKMEEVKLEMTPEEAKAYRASLYVPTVKPLTDRQKREQFRIFWAQAKRQYGKTKDLEEIVWLHLKSSKMDDPSQFDAGIANFGLKKVIKGK